MSKTDLNILLTRPLSKSQSLARDIVSLANHIEIQPLFEYLPTDNALSLSNAMVPPPHHIIFVSAAAARFAIKQCPVDRWPDSSLYYAVGPATKTALAPLGKSIAMGRTYDSEGLLALPQLANLDGEQVLIIRGDGGREYLAQTLRQRQANVAYNEVYRRQWLPFNEVQLIEKWRKLKINCMVVTSEALLDRAVELVSKVDPLYLQDIQWIVASERIAAKASEYGLQQVRNAGGANNQLIYQAIATL
ncbi:uroporphyrinogen-III synthase [Thalassotalea mangrovi]|nr:uroporphyrinogen-III synthase [Thalassotalea mangrovi]